MLYIRFFHIFQVPCMFIVICVFFVGATVLARLFCSGTILSLALLSLNFGTIDQQFSLKLC